MQNKKERVFAVPYLFTKHIEEGFSDKKESLTQFDNLGSFIFRSDAEGNKNLQQLIPFILIRDVSRKRFFFGKRLSGDERVHGQISCFGGHINEIDAKQTKKSLIESCLYRELNEELLITLLKKDNLSNSLQYIGTVRDTLSETGDHLGFVFILNVKTCSIKETDKIEGIWLSYHKTLRQFNKLDNWTQKIIEYLFKTTDLKDYLKNKKTSKC